MTPAKSSSIRNLFVCGASAVALSACGGGSSSSGNTGIAATSAPAPANGAFSLRSTANVRSNLTGSAVRLDAGFVALPDITGTFDHATTAVTLNDGQFSFADPSGVDANGDHQDGTAQLTLFNRTNAPFDFVNLFVQRYTLNGQQFLSEGVVGIASNVADIPTTGQATFTGDVFGNVTSGTTLQRYFGNSTVVADFGAGQTNVTFNNLRDVGTSAALAQVDTITVNNMTISGNSFSGGTLSTTNGGLPVDLTGLNTSTAAKGHFFGASGSAPDEVGGNVFSVGDDGLLTATFLAD